MMHFNVQICDTKNESDSTVWSTKITEQVTEDKIMGLYKLLKAGQRQTAASADAPAWAFNWAVTPQ